MFAKYYRCVVRVVIMIIMSGRISDVAMSREEEEERLREDGREREGRMLEMDASGMFCQVPYQSHTSVSKTMLQLS